MATSRHAPAPSISWDRIARGERGVALAFSSPARAQENFFQGKTIRLIVGSAPGGKNAMGMRPETAEKAEKE
jgi:hypothetical protein